MSPRDPLIQPLFAPADPGHLLPAVRGFALAEELFPPGARVLVAGSFVYEDPQGVAAAMDRLRVAAARAPCTD